MDVRKLRRLALVAAAPLVVGGCAPSFGGAAFGPGVHVGLNLGAAPGLSLSPATCLLQGSSNGMAGAGPAAAAGAMRQKAAQLQARYMMGASSPAARMGSWRSIASGDC